MRLSILKPQRPLNRALRFLPARQLLDIRHPALEVRVENATVEFGISTLTVDFWS
jgi:hypothetical protein